MQQHGESSKIDRTNMAKQSGLNNRELKQDYKDEQRKMPTYYGKKPII